MSHEVAAGINWKEPLIFEYGAPSRTGVSLGESEVPEVDPEQLYGSVFRDAAAAFPEVSEPEAVRHYVRLSQANFAIDTGFYPLGSCTMKYN